MPNVRVLPPADGLRPAIKINGRDYSCALGASIDMPDFDAAIAVGNGWTLAAGGTANTPGLSGTTAERPSKNLSKGQTFLDTTLGYTVTWDGKAWRHQVTGVAA